MPRLNPQTIGSILIDDTDPSTIYIGKAPTGASTSSAVWRIERITFVGSITEIKFANGSPEYNSIWDNRASLSYSLI